MNTLLVIGGCIIGYLLLGLIWARAQAVRVQKTIKEATKNYNEYIREHSDSNYRRGIAFHKYKPPFGYGLRKTLTGYALLWPPLLAMGLWSLCLLWVEKPVRKQKEQVAGLRARADKMAEMVDSLSIEEDRRILQVVIEENRQLAKELEI